MIERKLLSTLFLLDCKMSNVALSLAEAFDLARSDPTEENIRTYAVLAQADAFSKKASDGTVPDELIEKHQLGYALLEGKLALLNSSRSYRDEPWFEGAKSRIHQFFPPLAMEWEKVFSLCRFGPGVTCKTSGARGRYLLEKIGGAQTSTVSALPIFLEVTRDFFPNWAENLKSSSVIVVAGNRTAYVAKDVRKCRRIAIEPSCNLFLQMGVGEWMARRLSLFGVDISDQKLNRDLAREGSFEQKYATIDLSDASDSICRSLVRDLLPPDWFELLNRIRSHKSLDGHVFEKFSSQGNAFTFPLETLIFWAIAKETSKFCSVYGDDIICDNNSFFALSNALNSAGFTVNGDKSYSDGFFRESCGGDFIKGTDVRPVYYKEDCSRPSDVAKIHNLLISKWGWNLPLVRSYLVSLVRKPLFGPMHYWSTCKEKPWKNTLVSLVDAFFFDENETSWSRSIWRTTPVKVKWYNLHSARTRELAFLYAMRDIECVSALNKYTIDRSSIRRVGVLVR